MSSQWAAVGAETDLLRRARQLQESWERLVAYGGLGAEIPPGATAALRPTIVESWRRSLATGLDPTDLLAPIEAAQSEVLGRWVEHPLGSFAHVLTEQLRMVAEESRSIVVVTDASGLVLYRVGDEQLKERAAEMHLVEGARYSEATDGTNGIGTALAADHAFQVFGFEHFNERHHEWVCSGAPVHDPVSGQTIGLIDLSSLWKIAHPRSLELVTTAARTIEQGLLDARRDRDARLRRRYSDLMTKSTDLLVDSDGYVLEGAEPAHPSPFDIPAGGGEVVLGAGSVGVAVPLGRGEVYLLRRGTTRRGRSAPTAKGPARAEERARELATEQAALRRVATLVARESSPDQLFAVVAEQVAQVFDVPHVGLVRFEPDASVVVGGYTEGDREPSTLGWRWPPDSPGVIATVRQTGRPARIDDYGSVFRESGDLIRTAGMRSAVASPIVVEGRLWGALLVFTSRDKPIPEGTEARLADFSELVATAIANAESREARAVLTEEHAALRHVATLVAQGASPHDLFEAVAEEVGRLLPVGSATMGRFEPDGSVTTVASWSTTEAAFPTGGRWPTEGTNVAWMVRQTGESARLDDFSAATDPIGVAARDAGIKSAVGSPVVVNGHLWGVMTATSNEGPMPPGTEARLASFTELVATAIANAESSAELTASRRRIVAASDDARRRIERDLHDGVQQQLVSLGLKLRAINADPPTGDALEEQLASVTQAAGSVLDALVEIARGIHPAILAQGGLTTALEALARRSAVPVELHARIECPLPDEVEVAAYYVAAEALTNIAKHAHADVAQMDVTTGDGTLTLMARDDGVGGADPGGGSGLVGLQDRVEALGGAIKIDSSPVSGTCVLVTLPIAMEPDPIL